jgi:glycogen debranching enzyme
MPERTPEALRTRALEVLRRNRRGDWTCPSGELYPHQWLWDSCFVAMGLARHDPHRAAGELRALFRGQWANGMLPHMIFAAGSHDVGRERIWRSRQRAGAPSDVDTSCITQPPLVAVAVWRVARALRDADRTSFLAELFPRLVAYHQWLYRERDVEGHGLVTLIHPWECGLDSTPPWMQALARMPEPWWLRLALRYHVARIVRRLRRDTRVIPAEERTSDDDGLRMLVLLRRAERAGFERRRMPARTSVLIEDLAFNSLLAVANQSLQRIACELGETLDAELEASARATEAALESLWHESTSQYCSRDSVTGALLTAPTVATFLPLWAGTPEPERAARLVAKLREPSGWWPRFPVPTVPTDATEFEPERYWKGPTWVNANWMVVEGLRRHGSVAGAEAAEALRCATLELVGGSGFHEYFSALTGEGFGADDFSWTAALVLDLLDPDAAAPDRTAPDRAAPATG